ncbi:MAG: PIN domain-containing protein [Thermoflexales bacterium]
MTLDANIWVSAFDRSDSCDGQSIAFLTHTAQAHLRLHGPATVVLEVSCALGRHLRRIEYADQAALALHPINERLLDQALTLGNERGLRGVDALNAAAAALMDAPLISWDVELIQRAGAMRPLNWIASRANPDGGQDKPRIA